MRQCQCQYKILPEMLLWHGDTFWLSKPLTNDCSTACNSIGYGCTTQAEHMPVVSDAWAFVKVRCCDGQGCSYTEPSVPVQLRTPDKTVERSASRPCTGRKLCLQAEQYISSTANMYACEKLDTWKFLERTTSCKRMQHKPQCPCTSVLHVNN
jgi:hypothetical protein